VRPGRDDKVLADWNALAVTALCRAGAVFERPAWIDLVAEGFDFLLPELAAPDGRSAHGCRLGRITAAGLLDDQAAMARAALSLHEANGNIARLEQARELVTHAQCWFAAADGASYFTTASDAADIPLGAAARPRSVVDNATPSGNGLMAEVLACLHHVTGEAEYRDRAMALLAAFGGLGNDWVAAATLLAAADLLEEGAMVVITGPAEAPQTRTLLKAALAAPDPAVCVLRATAPDDLPLGHPAYGKVTQGISARQGADSDDAAHPFRDDRARHSDLMPPIGGVFVGGLI